MLQGTEVNIEEDTRNNFLIARGRFGSTSEDEFQWYESALEFDV